jgi:hypothetical protein
MALNSINNIFSVQPIGHEIVEYLENIISKMGDEEKKELLERISLFFPEMAKKSFLFQFDSNKSDNPLEKIISCFNGVWLLLKNLAPKTNFLTTKEVRQNIINMMGISINNFGSSSYDKISYQDISDVDLISIWGLGFTTNIEEVIFDHSQIFSCQFLGSDLINCKFQKTEISTTSIADCTLINCKFNNSEIEACDFTNTTFENVDFNGAAIGDITFKNCEFRKMKPHHFYNVSIKVKSLLELLNHGLAIDITKLKNVTKWEGNHEKHLTLSEVQEEIKLYSRG